ncbi:hypothetical protein DOTSEDRAFT_148740 [Dothistroma septosporum NZE10]|uniref:Uncharacterized protein n=1 Tax=Dothistroma septosporum (strain NZE10 / CBS 128990) TaxID=675120 RepID=N1PU62_DOTSN|nr:hypothetical protein DOTSEDRAFT_148740 [Dothistroma septosporum NZE10]
MASSRNGSSSAIAGSILLVVHDFIARSPDELSLAKGDRIELIERDDDFGDGWFLGKHLINGNSGLFPEVYTTPSPKATLAPANRFRASDSNNSTRVAQHAAVTALSASSKQADDAATSTSANTKQLPPDSQPMAPGTMTSQPLLASTALRSSLPSANGTSSATAGARSYTITSDSPVMSETLSVIDEHITDMKSPRTSYANGHKRDTLSSAYSSQPPPVRGSYIAGQETDDEEGQSYTEEEVMTWNAARVAEHLEDTGVEKAHCDVFVEQEISGEVLLAMDQNSLFLREFELGSVGRRLKTWHKIKALQDECRRNATPEIARSASNYSLDADEGEVDASAPNRNRSSTIGAPSLPRALTTKRQSGDGTPQRSITYQPQAPGISYSAAPSMSMRESIGAAQLQSMTAMSRSENPYRPSAQNIRNLNHSRRHSSIDSNSTEGASRIAHRKQPSLDQKWQPGQPLNGNAHHSYTASYDAQLAQPKSSAVIPSSPADLDRGYFSSNEAETRTRRTVLTKRNSTAVSPVHSRASSILGGSGQTPRITDAEGFDPVSPIVPPTHQAKAMSAVHKTFGSYRLAMTPGGRSKSGESRTSPIVTKLDQSTSRPLLNTIAASPTQMEDTASEVSSEKAMSSPSGFNKNIFASAKAKFTSKRSISEAVTRDEKVSSPTKVSSPVRSGTGSSTPSTENRSMDITKSDSNPRESTGSGQNLMPPPPARRPRAKSKKSTSAYTHGLAKISPQEQMITCDYSGWMKKKSGSVVAGWKPRLFVLKGRRLSYYYRDDDTEEKGLIDISFHKVLAVQHEKLAGMVASVTGAGGDPTSPMSGSMPTMAQQDLRDHPPADGEQDEGVFIFKLVPPKAGLAKGVSFTKPAVHYFAVNSRQEGRLWMAALMKATIDRDDNGVVTTTYNQKTISLTKARARRERPPALKEETVYGRVELATNLDDDDEKGLGIVGAPTGDRVQSAIAGAEQQSRTEDASSMAPSTTATGESDLLNDKEREAVALDGSG